MKNEDPKPKLPSAGSPLIEKLIESVRGPIEWFGGLSLLGGQVFRECFRRPFEFRRSTPLIILSGLAVGIVLSMHTLSTLERFGAAAMIPTALAFALVKETGPLITGLLISGRVGAGIGAELGGMRVTEQIDALESLAVNSFKYLVFTRVVACAFCLPLLTVVMDFSGMLGGFIAEAVISGSTLRFYFAQAFGSLGFSDFIPATLKTVVFGLIIGGTSSFLGYNATGGAAGVGRAATQSVVFSSVLLILMNVILVKFIAFLFPVAGG